MTRGATTFGSKAAWAPRASSPTSHWRSPGSRKIHRPVRSLRAFAHFSRVSSSFWIRFSFQGPFHVAVIARNLGTRLNSKSTVMDRTPGGAPPAPSGVGGTSALRLPPRYVHARKVDGGNDESKHPPVSFPRR